MYSDSRRSVRCVATLLQRKSTTKALVQVTYPGGSVIMGSWASLLSPNSALTYLLVLLLPSIPSLIGRYRRSGAPTAPHLRQAPAPRRPLRLYLILAIHTLYRIQQLLVPPFNVFTHFHLPITANREYLQASLWRYHSTLSGLTGRAAHYDPNQLPSNILRFSNRLSNIDYRLLYARYGHEALEGCMWCSSQADFAVVSLPGIVGAYVGVAVLLGLMGWASVGGAGAAGRADRMRGKAGWGLVGAALGEVAVRYMWELRVVEGDCLQVCAFILAVIVIQLRRVKESMGLSGVLTRVARRDMHHPPQHRPAPHSPHLHLPPSRSYLISQTSRAAAHTTHHVKHCTPHGLGAIGSICRSDPAGPGGLYQQTGRSSAERCKSGRVGATGC